MKKQFLILSLLSAFALGTQAQTSPFTKTRVGDTITNATTGYITVTKVADGLVSVDAVLTKVANTIGGYALLQGSNDGIYWYDLNTDTLTYQNQASNKKAWTITGKFPYRDFRVAFKSTSSSSTAIPQISYTRRIY